MYTPIDHGPQASASPAPPPVPTPVAPRPASSTPVVPPRGPRGAQTAPPVRGGRGAFAGGRGRGGSVPTPIARPASPLPPGVPTGPRNQNKYKDRDNNAPAVDGLDYGGTPRYSSGEPEERSRYVIFARKFAIAILISSTENGEARWTVKTVEVQSGAKTVFFSLTYFLEVYLHVVSSLFTSATSFGYCKLRRIKSSLLVIFASAKKL
jgi:hypothetical protein